MRQLLINNIASKLELFDGGEKKQTIELIVSLNTDELSRIDNYISSKDSSTKISHLSLNDSFINLKTSDGEGVSLFL
ncbi:hypothetical protein LX69_01093 [Breznakibacter xylanolyticus]|uniref:Uncharacterized protein n=1 Tax=Breznakibacter xylanolyticus TaxID=990 RepID=A0A2W7NIV5_9BACT|nr:hypothetical protein [Breznakibacter xylanolyticus]PZX18057.1 hypothetical protein LX69_01093 [Breznakibacter xylanolyticus]